MKKLFNHKKRPYDDAAYDEWEGEEYDSEAEEYEADEEDYESQEEDRYYIEEAEDEAYYAEEDSEEVYYAGEDSEEAFYAEEDSGEGYYAGEDSEEVYYAGEDSGEGYYAGEDSEEGYFAEETSEEACYAGEDSEEGYYMEEDSEEAYYAEEDAEEGYHGKADREGYSRGRTVNGYRSYKEPLRGAAAGDDVSALYRKNPSRSGKRAGNRKRSGSGKQNIFQKGWSAFLNMSTFDRIITSTGVAVLVLALVTGSVYVSASMLEKQVKGFVSVGRQLDGVGLLGETGLLAVADAEQARIAAANAVADGGYYDDEESDEYKEEEFSKDVTVTLSMSSIQKDLKIKFVNKESGKLVANVPFRVTITDPSGKSSTWTDDDMDGIIYKKDIAPGKYKVAVEELDSEKYKEYTLPDSQESVEVKKDISYKKVDVGNEIKKESEINASKEDTKINENKVESKLQDTVTWVESTSTSNTYTEVPKNTVPDPDTLAYAGGFYRLAYSGNISPASKTLNVGETFTLTASSQGVVLNNVTWKSSNPSVATVDAGGKVTAVGKGSADITFLASGTAVSGNEAVTGLSGSCRVTVNEVLGAGKVTVDNGSHTIAIGKKATAKASVSGFNAGKELTYSITSNNTKIVTASIDGAGNITIEGVAAGDAALTVKVNYKEGGSDSTAATVPINVKVTGKKAMTLDKTTAVVYLGSPVTINASIANAVTDSAVTAESSDTGVATVAVDKRAVTITGVKAGSATITVKYTENGEELKASCTITVKSNPREDRNTRLKDTSGRQLYVLEGDQYREAVYADYYTAGKFFIKGEMKYTGWQTLDGKVYFFDGSGRKVTGEQVIQGARYNFASDGTLVTGSGTRGIDVSKWNGTIDWNAVKNSGISYVIIRCGYRGSSAGALIEDPTYRKNIKGATAAGLKVGVYFFTQAVNEREAIEEASMVLELVKNYKISYPIFLDVESSGGRADSIDKSTRTAVCKAFSATIQDAGYTAGIYANKNWLTNKIDASQLSAYKIWLAQYASTPTYTGRYDLWQYQSTGRVSGISGNVDMNWSYLGY